MWSSKNTDDDTNDHNDPFVCEKLVHKYSAYAQRWYVAERWAPAEPKWQAWPYQMRNVRYHVSYRDSLDDLRERFL